MLHGHPHWGAWRKNLKKSFIIIFVLSVFFISCYSKTPQKIDNVKITQNYYDQFYGETISAKIYDGNPTEIIELVGEVQNAKNISVLFCIKEALIDGRFVVEFYQDDKIILNYEICNSQNAYDEIKHKFKKIRAIDLIPNKIKNTYEHIPAGTEMLIREDFFRNCSEMTIKSVFTDIHETTSFIYSKDYFPSTEIEPDYHKYLNENYYGKTIRVLHGRKNNKNIVLWLYEENKTWKCFSSVEFTDSVRF